MYGGRSTTDEEICGLLIAALFAGQHTSSITTSWTGLFMTANKVGGGKVEERGDGGAWGREDWEAGRGAEV